MTRLTSVSTLLPEPSSLKLDLLRLLDEKQRRKRENRLTDYWPYTKQCQFHEDGATHRERFCAILLPLPVERGRWP